MTGRVHLWCMEPRPTTLTLPDAVSTTDMPKSLGARMATASRQRQGLDGMSVHDPAARERLRALCRLPKLRASSGAPDELDTASQ